MNAVASLGMSALAKCMGEKSVWMFGNAILSVGLLSTAFIGRDQVTPALVLFAILGKDISKESLCWIPLNEFAKPTNFYQC